MLGYGFTAPLRIREVARSDSKCRTIAKCRLANGSRAWEPLRARGYETKRVQYGLDRVKTSIMHSSRGIPR